MSLAKRLVLKGEESAKKNDHTRQSAGQTGAVMMALRGLRRKRFFLIFAVIGFTYLFIKYLPTDLPPVAQRYDSRYGQLHPNTPTTPSVEQGPPPRPNGATKEYYFDGPVKFYHLTKNLFRGIVRDDNGRNILFAISNLKSASNIVPMACEMSRQDKNKVHVALFGRNEVTADMIKEIHGIEDTECIVSWYDARPDYSVYSSDLRMETSARAALNHLHAYLKPQAIIVDDTGSEDDFFLQPARESATQMDVPLIALPRNSIESLAWLNKLDSSSLRKWNSFQIEIVVHGSALSSGSFIRLLKSIEEADYFGTVIPKLTVELPASTDPPTLEFLSRFRWPPESLQGDSKLSVRRRISRQHITPVEASLRTVESFFPVQADKSHVLVLTPEAELSPTYFHFLTYALLEYKYSTTAMLSSAKLLGISFEEPSKYLDGSNASFSQVTDDTSLPLLLWQAPSSRAALYFGDMWTEFHSFLSHRVSVSAGLPAETFTTLVSKEYPAWLTYMLELMRARGYSMLYPRTGRDLAPLVTIHNELYHLPEEFANIRKLESAKDADAVATLNPEEVLIAEIELKVGSGDDVAINSNQDIISHLSSGPLRDAVLNETGLPLLRSVMLLSYDGTPLTPLRSMELSATFADHFSLHNGGCKSLEERAAPKVWAADDLFCFEE